MKYYYVNVEDRQSKACVCVGAMLAIQEAKKLMHVLEEFNACDLLITCMEEKF